MESARFDAIARRLTTVSSRRDAVRVMTVAGLGIGLMQAGDAEAKKKKKKRPKKLLQECKSGGKRKCGGDLQCGDRDTGTFKCRKPLFSACADGEECLEGSCLPINILDADSPKVCKTVI